MKREFRRTRSKWQIYDSDVRQKFWMLLGSVVLKVSRNQSRVQSRSALISEAYISYGPIIKHVLRDPQDQGTLSSKKEENL